MEGAGDIGLSIVEAVSNMLGEIKWNDITISLSGFVDMLSNGISAAVKSMSSAETSIVQAISDFLGKINWNDAQVNLSAFGTSIINGIATAIASAASGATDIANAIVDLIAKVDWTNFGEQMSNLCGSLISALLEGMKNITPDLSELMSALGRGIAAAGSAIGDVASVIVTDLVSALLSPDNWLKLIEAGGAIVKGIATGILNLA